MVSLKAKLAVQKVFFNTQTNLLKPKPPVMKRQEMPMSRRLKGLYDYSEAQKECRAVKIVMGWYDKLYKKNYTWSNACGIINRAKKMYNI